MEVFTMKTKKANNSQETRANTRGLISRSITATLVSLVVYNKSTKNTESVEYAVTGEPSDKDIIKAYNNSHDNMLAVDIIERKTETHLYAMNVETFIANSVIVD